MLPHISLMLPPHGFPSQRMLSKSSQLTWRASGSNSLNRSNSITVGSEFALIPACSLLKGVMKAICMVKSRNLPSSRRDSAPTGQARLTLPPSDFNPYNPVLRNKALNANVHRPPSTPCSVTTLSWADDSGLSQSDGVTNCPNPVEQRPVSFETLAQCVRQKLGVKRSIRLVVFSIVSIYSLVGSLSNPVFHLYPRLPRFYAWGCWRYKGWILSL